MIGRLALRSLTAHPIRSAVLAAGFGVGVAVMAILLGVAEVVLQQAQSPALVGGGDVLVRLGPQVPGRLLLSGTLQSDALRDRVETAAPFHTAGLVLLHDGRRVRVGARGGIPSLERRMGDPETAGVPGWNDAPGDVAWTEASPGEVLRQVDRFHPVPDTDAWGNSWAEWLYFNGRSADARFYLTFMVGGPDEAGRRPAGVRLQLERHGVMQTFGGAAALLTQADVDRAPDLSVGGNSVRLDGLVYRIQLDLRDAGGRHAVATLAIAASPGRLVPPIEITGARGWRTGYVVPVMSGALNGTVDVDGERITFADAAGYHDHNWGFWQGVSWQWGQAQNGPLSVLYGRVFPPAEAADPARLPGFVGAIGPDGPLGYTTNVQIDEDDGPGGRPRRITVRARGSAMDLTLRFDTASAVTTRMQQGPLGNDIDFLQLRGTYTVHGTASGQPLEFTAGGSAETFRGGR